MSSSVASGPFLSVIVIGGGAAGFFAAITCAQTHPHCQVTLVEAGRDCLSKVRISGGGRCNVTHACFDPAQLVQYYPRGGKALRGAFSRFQPQDTIAWFQSRGIALKTEADGRIFPQSDRSDTIIHCLETAAAAAGVSVEPGSGVVALEEIPPAETAAIANSPPGARFRVTLKNGEVRGADRLLLATGSSASGYRFAQHLGHSLIPPVPSLFTFQVRDPALHARAGVSVPQAQVRLKVGTKTLEQTGALLITHWGFSGPAILKLSAWGARLLHESQYHGALSVHWLPDHSPDRLRETLLEAKTSHSRKQLSNYCPLALPQRLWGYLLERSHIAPDSRWADLSKTGLNRLVTELSQGHYAIQGKGVFKDEFVTCGGVSLKEVDFKTMASRCCPGLYLAGEILDVDGVTGGFNFQNAWTTGWLAGQALGQGL
ncbi:BaiN/RdsA family NAD(P)/FAD-dependent oxidoreductase [Prochlorothrix hollandica]|uniref:Flavoprotein n=1 Tax=Prochlorothrix hollandica PCC 9006 = CALU 1027 TaxID=317619 RepID=A0A0M2PWX4_PROHO|nr:NAD(P)/FAD-dependent oxidoreductase [Prochlorothrix hollandica]KKJ00931.1 flavoprotein [Prochlorothrix hollandica PCC 9006 = CALU 1027]